MIKGKTITKNQYKKYFGADGYLKIFRQWDFNGKTYIARRDTDDYITIDDFNCGIHYCFDNQGLDQLIKKLGIG